MKKYRMYVDESGDHTFCETEDPPKKYLGLFGLIIECSHYRETFRPGLEELKQRHFPHNPDDPVILHREDLVSRRGPFWRLRDREKQAAFDADLLKFLQDQTYVIISVVLDKNRHFKRYGQAAYHPYHYCLTVMLERYCGYLNFCGARGDVLAESRGGTEDRQLKLAYREVYEKGTYFRDQEFFQRALTSAEIKLKQKSENIAGLQIADLLVHPCKLEILAGLKLCEVSGDTFGVQICKCVGAKYNHHAYQGRVWGYGKIFIG